jgi:hypothetical protein
MNIFQFVFGKLNEGFLIKRNLRLTLGRFNFSGGGKKWVEKGLKLKNWMRDLFKGCRIWRNWPEGTY